MKDRKTAILSLERELRDELQILSYEQGNGDFFFHSQMELCIVEEGQIDALVANSAGRLSRGAVCVSLRNDPHRYVSEGRVKYTVLVLPSEISEHFYASLGERTLSSRFITDAAVCEKMLSYLAALKTEKSELSRLGYVYLMLGLVAAQASPAKTEAKPDAALLSRLLLYLHENCAEDLSLARLASTFGYHPSYLSGYFKASLGIGLSRYVGILRLKNALMLMQSREKGMTEIALDCGFGSSRSFYRAFQREFVCSPKEYLQKSETE